MASEYVMGLGAALDLLKKITGATKDISEIRVRQEVQAATIELSDVLNKANEQAQIIKAENDHLRRVIAERDDQ